MDKPDLRYFNLNEAIRVKLTQRGLDLLKAQHDEMRKRFPSIGEWKAPEVDADGWTTMQAWSFMRDLGEHFGLGAAPDQQPALVTVAFDSRHLKGTL